MLQPHTQNQHAYWAATVLQADSDFKPQSMAHLYLLIALLLWADLETLK